MRWPIARAVMSLGPTAARGAAVLGRAFVAGEALADEGLVHHTEHRRAVVQKRVQRAPDRKAADEGFCAVDGIEHPDIVGVLALAAEFLADNAVLGEVGLDQPPHD